MSKHPQQPWKIVFTDTSDRQFRALTYPQKQGVFDALRPVLEAVNPTHAPGVIKLTDVQPPVYRVRARNHRILFEVIPDPSNEDPPRWKGKIRLINIIDRKDVY